jgi:glycosyltransferase involved in cell wall biosynthesis
MKKLNKVIVLGPDTNRIGGISECIKSLLNSKLKSEFDLYHFKTDVIFKGNFIFKLCKKTLTFFSFVKLLFSNYQVCHIHSSSYYGFFERVIYAVLCKAFSTKVIFHIHGGEFLNFYNRSSVKWFIRFFLRKIDSVIFVDKQFESIISNKMSKYIPNMIAMPERIESSKNNPEHIFLSVSVLEARKNIDLIIECCNELSNRELKFKFYICGNGPEQEYLEKMVVNYKLSDSIIFFGPVSGGEKLEVFNKANTFILASHSESFGIVLIESLSFGVDIISTAVGIAPELDSNLDNIDLFHINDKNKLLDLMEKKVKNHKNFSFPSIVSINYCKDNFSIEAIQNCYIEIYKEVQNEH